MTPPGTAGFSSFLGNPRVVLQLRESVAHDRLPSSILLSGPRGVGKYTLALTVAQTLNCLRLHDPEFPTPDGLPEPCGVCSNCTRIAASADLDSRIAEAVAARDDLRETDKKDTRILIQTHPDVLIVPPDPPQLLIKIGQVRSVIHSIHYRPAEGRRKVYIFTAASFMKEAANSLLKILEEPPPYAHIILLAENAGDLLPTIRSRASKLHLGALPIAEIDALLAARKPEWKPADRRLVARLAEGAPGRALSFDLPAYTAARADALELLRTGIQPDDHSALFKITDTYRAGADGHAKTDALLRTTYTLLEDLVLIQSSTPQLVRNIDILPQLTLLAEATNFAWIESAVIGLGHVESGMRRNLLRSLSLDAFATGLSR